MEITSKAFVYGSAEDYNRWGELVGDGELELETCKRGFQKRLYLPTFPLTGSQMCV